jgi:hypothetical protein
LLITDQFIPQPSLIHLW